MFIHKQYVEMERNFLGIHNAIDVIYWNFSNFSGKFEIWGQILGKLKENALEMLSVKKKSMSKFIEIFPEYITP
jgi:hypothetical protein